MQEFGVNFSETAFRTFLSRLVSRGLPVFTVSEWRLAALSRHSIVLRHDVDVSLEMALKLAEIENAFGIRSTYFVLLRSPFYNALSLEGISALRAIVKLGHEVGLHWDGRLIEEDLARETISQEAQMLAQASGQPVVSVSQHFPTTSKRLDLSDLFVDTYSAGFQKQFVYVSDSSMAWRDKDLDTILNIPASYHLLLHPVWWVNEFKTRRQKVEAACSDLKLSADLKFKDFIDFVEACLLQRELLDQKFKTSLSARE